jgi:hypothetical protein
MQGRRRRLGYWQCSVQCVQHVQLMCSCEMQLIVLNGKVPYDPYEQAPLALFCTWCLATIRSNADGRQAGHQPVQQLLEVVICFLT